MCPRTHLIPDLLTWALRHIPGALLCTYDHGMRVHASRAVLTAAVFTIVLSSVGCSATTEVPQARPYSSNAAVSQPASGSDGPISLGVGHVCGQVSSIVSLEQRAVRSYSDGSLTQEDFALLATAIKESWAAIVVTHNNPVAPSVVKLKHALKQDPQIAPDSDEWRALSSAIGESCEANGSSVAIAGQGG